MPQRDGGSRRRHRWLWWIAAGVVALVAAAGIWVGVRGILAKNQLEALPPLATQAQQAAAAGDLVALREVTGRIAAHAGEAASLTSDPIWRATEVLPWVGPNTAAVRLTSQSLRDVATSAGPVIDALDATGEASTDAEGWDLGVIQNAASPLADFAGALGAASTELSGIDPSVLLAPLRDGVTRLSAPITEAAGAAASASSAASVLPGMLGADGPRSILLMVQNPAEVRTAGGLAGSFVLLSADHGRVRIAGQADSSQFPPLPDPAPLMTPSSIELYGENAGTYVQNITMTPDFAATAQLALQWWASVSAERPDLVVSIDPTVLGALIGPSAPITLSDGSTLTSDNLVDRVLVNPYLTMTAEEQTAFQRSVTEAVFDRVLTGRPDPVGWARALADPIGAGRVSLWSAREDEENLLAASPLGGLRARQLAAGPGAVSVALNDATTGKLDSFLETSVSAGIAACGSTGRELIVEVSLTSTATDAARAYPPLMTGSLGEVIPPGDIATNVAVAAPPGYLSQGVFLDGTPTTSRSADDDGRATTVARLQLPPGAGGTLAFHFLAASGAAEAEPVVVLPPLLRPASLGSPLTPTCS